MKIFSYGSNMNLARLKERVPTAVYVTIASINNYTLKLKKISKDGSSKATILPTENEDDIVWGVIFEIDDSEKEQLDKAEGLGSGYNQDTKNFTDEDGNGHFAQVYIADNAALSDELLPYDWYMEFIITGARQNQLPKEYIDRILSIENIVDRDEKRRQKNLSLIAKN